MEWTSLKEYLESCSSSFELAERGVRDVEFDWFARDTNGAVAMLTSGAQVLVPRVVLQDKAAYLLVCTTFYRLPERGEAQLKRSGSGDFEEWVSASRRGLYAYDWDEGGRLQDSYAIVSVPERPILAEELGGPSVGLASFAGDFSRAFQVTASDFG